MKKKYIGKKTPTDEIDEKEASADDYQNTQISSRFSWFLVVNF